MSINKILQSVDFTNRKELLLTIAKKNIDYVFSKDFEKEWERESLREIHPALKDLHSQYKEMEALLKKEENTK